MNKNRRIIITKYGGPEVLQLIDEPIPKPSRNEVLIKVLSTGIAHGDIMIRKGIMTSPLQKLPLTPGFEIVGVVKEVGDNVSLVKKDQLVAALTVVGGYSEYICLNQKELIPVPSQLNPDEAACLVLNYVTAYQMLHRNAHIQEGDKILVHGAAGGVGTAILQLGNAINLKMFGTASLPKHSLISSLHAVPIDYRNTDFVDEIRHHLPEGVDVVFDGIGGINYKKSYQTLQKHGRLIGYGFQDGKNKISILSSLLRLMSYKFIPVGKKAIFYSIVLVNKTQPDTIKEDLTILFQLLANRTIQPIINKKFPLSEARAAHEMFEQRNVIGKILLTM